MIPFLIAGFYYDGLYKIIHFTLSTALQILVPEGPKCLLPKGNVDSKTTRGDSMVSNQSRLDLVVENTGKPMAVEKVVKIASSIVETSGHGVRPLCRSEHCHKRPATFSADGSSKIIQEITTYPIDGPISIGLSVLEPIGGLPAIEKTEEISSYPRGGLISANPSIDNEQPTEGGAIASDEENPVVMNVPDVPEAFSSLVKYNHDAPGRLIFPNGLTPAPVTWTVIGSARNFIRRELSPFEVTNFRHSLADVSRIFGSTRLTHRPLYPQRDVVISSLVSNAVEVGLKNLLRQSISHPVSRPRRSAGGVTPSVTSVTLLPNVPASFPSTGSTFLRAFAQASRCKEPSSEDTMALKAIEKELALHLQKHVELQARADEAISRLRHIWTRAYNAAYRRCSKAKKEADKAVHNSFKKTELLRQQEADIKARIGF